MTRDFFNQQFAAMLAVYTYARSMPDEGQDVYWEMLKGLSSESFTHGVRRCLEHCKFFPTIADLLEASRSLPREFPKLLEGPQLSAEQVEKNRATIRTMIEKLERKLS